MSRTIRGGNATRATRASTTWTIPRTIPRRVAATRDPAGAAANAMGYSTIEAPSDAVAPRSWQDEVKEIAYSFAPLGFIAFGGPQAHIAWRTARSDRPRQYRGDHGEDADRPQPVRAATAATTRIVRDRFAAAPRQRRHHETDCPLSR